MLVEEDTITLSKRFCQSVEISFHMFWQRGDRTLLHIWESAMF